MDTAQLQVILNKHPATKLYFGGVFAKDELPWHARHLCYIVNLDSRKEPGSHWVAIYFDKNGQAEFFDSFGFSPSIDRSILSFIKRNSIIWSYNAQQLQNQRTIVCGQYCVFYLINRCQQKSLKKIISVFTSNTLKNDRFVKNYLDNIYPNMKLTLT